MEKFAYILKDMIREKRLMYEALGEIFKKEKQNIIDMDIKSLWESTEQKKQIASSIEENRRNILEAVENHGLTLEMDVQTFSLSKIIESLPFDATIKSEFKKANVELDIMKKDLVTRAVENRGYVDKTLSVVDGIFSTITSSGKKDQYNRSGKVSKDKEQKHLIRAEV